VPKIFSPAIGELIGGIDGKKTDDYFDGAEAVDFVR
jgi:hypothetical protein